MTHAEAKDLLLEHAYGELPAHVAGGVAEHLTECDECRREQAAIGSVRAAFAPLAGLEEPSEGFDGRILAAARAEAQLTHDGNIGEVVEVTASAAPSGIEAASVDAYARPVPLRAERGRPKWMKAAAAAASVAAVAALAVVVGTSNRATPRAPEESYAIRVAPQVVPSSTGATDATAPRQAVEREEPAARQQPAQAPPRPLAAQAETAAAPPQAVAARKQQAEAPPPAPAAQNEQPQPPPPPRAARNRQPEPPSPALTAPKEPAPAAEERTVVAKKRAAEKGTATNLPAAGELLAGDTQRTVANASERAIAKTSSGQSTASPAAESAPEVSPAELERRAGAARRSGYYPLAAELYRKAAQGRTDDAPSAAWDLAHAVECLSAAGSFAEARAVRDELKQRYPAESGASSAARRALREVDPRE